MPREIMFGLQCHPWHCLREAGKSTFSSPIYIPSLPPWLQVAIRCCWWVCTPGGRVKMPRLASSETAKSSPGCKVKMASYKYRTEGEEKKEKHLISLNLSYLSLLIAWGSYKALILASQLTGTRTSPLTDKPTKTEHTLFPIALVSKKTLFQCLGGTTPHAPAHRPLPHSIAFLLPCSEIPNFAAKIQQRRKAASLHDYQSPHWPFFSWEQQGLHLIPEGRALAGLSQTH